MPFLQEISSDDAYRNGRIRERRKSCLGLSALSDRTIAFKSQKAALAAECAAELGGDSGFWNYLDKYFEITPSNNLINLSDLPKIAKDIGLDKSRFEECLESGRYDELIKEQTQNALDSGSRGTPYSVLISKDGEKSSINGALPYEDFEGQDGVMQKGVRALIEEALR